MTEDLQSRTTSPQQPEHPAPKAGIDLSISKLLGGALAAMTAAALGSRLSVAGTLIGAALASVIAAVATAVYSASLSRTHEKVRTVFTTRSGADGSTTADPQRVSPQPVPDWTVAKPTPEPAVTGWTSGSQPPRPPRRRLNWKGIVVGAFAIFAVAAAVLTGIELISGQALSGGSGTTITQVSEAQEPKSTPRPTPSATETPSAGTTPSETPAPEPSTADSSTPEPSSAPTAVPSEPTPSASEAPSASASEAEPEPSVGAGAGTGEQGPG